MSDISFALDTTRRMALEIAAQSVEIQLYSEEDAKNARHTTRRLSKDYISGYNAATLDAARAVRELRA